MGQETNLDSTLALEKQSEEDGVRNPTKRTRNSLLNMSILLPPEILGAIFRWNTTPGGDFGGLSKGSYNFLLVCHHWSEVALCTPELWNFWGNSIRDWARRHARCGNAPLDLVLGAGKGHESMDDMLWDALQDRAARDITRRVHLSSTNVEVLDHVLSSIIDQGKEIRSNRVESFIVKNDGESFVNVSAFISRYHFPKLQRLRLSGCRIALGSLLKSQITALTTLELTSIELSPTPTLSNCSRSSPLSPSFNTLYYPTV